ncbi:MAG: hypothetical protein ACI4MN_02470 [Candidatus Coproplasma sp.]
MENDLFDEEIEVQHSLKKKIWLEFKDLMAGCAFPLIIMIIFSSTIITFSVSKDVDLYIRLIALIGGELMLAVALFIFGRTNGSEAYKKTIDNDRKRKLNSSDERVFYRTGEYALWKGVLIGIIVCIPSIIILIIQLCVTNTFCTFMLQYVFSWIYAPFSFLNDAYMPLCFTMLVFPIGIMTLGYYFGKRRQIKIQEELAKTNPDDKRSQVVDIPGEKKKGGKSNKRGKK